jgi:hypothetical protein
LRAEEEHPPGRALRLREHMGRKPLSNAQEWARETSSDVVVSFRFPPALLGAIDGIALSEGLSRSDWLRRIVLAALDAKNQEITRRR